MKQPTEAQKAAGNYKKRHDRVLGMHISIENPAGTHRSGVDEHGKLWKNKVHHDYGYIKGTVGRDKDHIDVFLGPKHTDGSKKVHVIDQVDPKTRKFDEHKVMLGFDSVNHASEAYHKNYEPGWTGVGAVTPMTMQEFKAWAFKPGRRTKPVSHLAEKGFAEGGVVDPVEDLSKPAFGNPNITRQGHRAGATTERSSDYEDQHNAFTAALAGALGSAPDEIAGSVLDPKTADNRNFAAMGMALSPLGFASPASMAKSAVSGVKSLGLSAAKTIARGMEGEGALSKVLAPVAPAYVVKPKGGNWLGEHTGYDYQSPERVASLSFDRGSREVKNWSQKNLVKFLKNDFATPTDPLEKAYSDGRVRLPFDALPNDELGAQQLAQHHELTDRLPNMYDVMSSSVLKRGLVGDTRREQIDKFLSGHSDPSSVRTFEDLKNLKPDGSVNDDIVNPVSMQRAAEIAASNGWMDKVDYLTPVHSFTPAVNAHLRLDHLRDYLAQAHASHEVLNAYGGPERARVLAGNAWPADVAEPITPGVQDALRRALHLHDNGLALSTDQLARTSVPDAYTKMTSWDDLLQKAKADVDFNKGIKKVHRQYPDGHQWVELDPEGLAAEGDAMRHCVGGYCSEVESGKARILSLRDKTGKPLTTVELKPLVVDHGADGVVRPGWPQYDMPKYLPEAQADLDALFKKHGMEPSKAMTAGVWPHDNINVRHRTLIPMERGRYIPGAPPPDTTPMTAKEHAAMLKDLRAWKEKYPKKVVGHAVEQIKGFANGAPKPDALPMVQDLLRNPPEEMGKWGRVRDMHHTQMHDTENIETRATPTLPPPLWDGIPPIARGRIVEQFRSTKDPDGILLDRVLKAYRAEQLNGARFGTADDFKAWVNKRLDGEKK